MCFSFTFDQVFKIDVNNPCIPLFFSVNLFFRFTHRTYHDTSYIHRSSSAVDRVVVVVTCCARAVSQIYISHPANMCEHNSPVFFFIVGPDPGFRFFRRRRQRRASCPLSPPAPVPKTPNENTRLFFLQYPDAGVETAGAAVGHAAKGADRQQIQRLLNF